MTLPRKNITATSNFTNGQIFIGKTEVLAPVSKLNPAMTMSINADALYTMTDTGFRVPTDIATGRTSKPIKHGVRPSAIHPIVTIRRLSSDICPKPSTTGFVGTIWAIPHRVIKINPVNNNIGLITSLYS
ncbi:MAG TPA: hypothetical protein VM123_16275 [archaeon]|nr:hypothetical protein [archaeon]